MFLGFDLSTQSLTAVITQEKTSSEGILMHEIVQRIAIVYDSEFPRE